MRKDWDDDDLDEGRHEDFDDDGYIECPHCGKTMLEDAEYCPSCDRWMSDEDAPKPAQPFWIIIGIALCLGVALTWIMRL